MGTPNPCHIWRHSNRCFPLITKTLRFSKFAALVPITNLHIDSSQHCVTTARKTQRATHNSISFKIRFSNIVNFNAKRSATLAEMAAQRATKLFTLFLVEVEPARVERCNAIVLMVLYAYSGLTVVTPLPLSYVFDSVYSCLWLRNQL